MLEIAVTIGIVLGITQLFKGLNLFKKKYLPLFSLFVAVAITSFYGTGDWKENVITGIMIGLSASGLFDQTKIVTKRTDKK